MSGTRGGSGGSRPGPRRRPGKYGMGVKMTANLVVRLTDEQAAWIKSQTNPAEMVRRWIDEARKGNKDDKS